MNRKDIIEALRRCTRGECDVCPYQGKHLCGFHLKHDAANLIEIMDEAPSPALIELQNRLHYYRGMLKAHQDIINGLKKEAGENGEV